MSLSKLYFPNRFESSAIDEVSKSFGRWSIVVDDQRRGVTRHMTVRDYFTVLGLEEIPFIHKQTISVLSMVPKPERYRNVIESFDLSRFCEMRAALGALQLPRVEAVRVTERNSSFDQGKADLLIAREGGMDCQPLQVKAKAGKASKASSAVPTIRNVWELRFSELVRLLRDLVERP